MSYNPATAEAVADHTQSVGAREAGLLYSMLQCRFSQVMLTH